MIVNPWTSLDKIAQELRAEIQKLREESLRDREIILGLLSRVQELEQKNVRPRTQFSK